MIIVVIILSFVVIGLILSLVVTYQKTEKEHILIGDYIVYKNKENSNWWTSRSYSQNIHLYNKVGKCIDYNREDYKILFLNRIEKMNNNLEDHILWVKPKNIELYTPTKLELKKFEILEMKKNKKISHSKINKCKEQEIENEKIFRYSEKLLVSKLNENEITYSKFEKLISALYKAVNINIEKCYDIIHLLCNLSDDTNLIKIKDKKEKTLKDILNLNSKILTELNICLVNIFDLNDLVANEVDVNIIIKELEKLYELIKKFK